ncbi:MAG: hypothetical protein HKL92_00415 [Candidatus Eremiobacteraeota bacterium]|nr:hypothetical protein [Candidatus Eremiobacteraeota bacterium]
MRLMRTLLVGIVAAAGMLLAPHAAAASTYADDHGNVYIGKDVTIEPGQVVHGDLTVIGGNADIKGSVERDLTVLGGGATIEGSVGRDVTVLGGAFTQMPGAHVGRHITTIGLGHGIMRILPSIGVSSGNGSAVVHTMNPFGVSIVPWLAGGKIIGDFLVLIAFLIFPMRARLAMERLEQHPGLATAVGLGAWIAVLPLGFMLLITVILSPLILVEVLAIIVALLIGKAALALIIGNRLMVMTNAKVDPSPLLALVVGLVLITAAELVPIAGFLVTMLVVLVGVGATVLSLAQPTMLTGGYMPPTAPVGPMNVTPPPQPPIGGPPMPR